MPLMYPGQKLSLQQLYLQVKPSISKNSAVFKNSKIKNVREIRIYRVSILSRTWRRCSSWGRRSKIYDSSLSLLNTTWDKVCIHNCPSLKQLSDKHKANHLTYMLIYYIYIYIYLSMCVCVCVLSWLQAYFHNLMTPWTFKNVYVMVIASPYQVSQVANRQKRYLRLCGKNKDSVVKMAAKETWPRGLIDIRSQDSTLAFSSCLSRWEINAVPTSVVARRHCPWWPNSIATRFGPTVSLSTASSRSGCRIALWAFLTATRAASWSSWANLAPVHPIKVFLILETKRTRIMSRITVNLSSSYHKICDTVVIKI